MKFVFNRLSDYLEKRFLIYSSKQFGLCSHHSTDHVVLSIIDNVQRSIEDSEFSFGVFLDFSKALRLVFTSDGVGAVVVIGVIRELMT